ncbi:YIP1 family protein [Thalassococcus sp. CAU 1522]|uniref:YIP1 family protein n=1 Tax=Thalassococcus arenae TaxID=2851652 RepID=A0ABS6NB05_9RHOB|nr:YIP1 family protein [Thalassococcus arenae]MBV2361197.1 YIP1 family protein [Thalassococcus arenae]
MTLSEFRPLVLLSVTDPKETARRIVTLNLPPNALVTAFLLVLVLNTLVFQLGQIVAPTPVPRELAMVVGNPGAFIALLGASMAAMALALTWTGQMMGGAGRLSDLAALIVWLQALRVLAQAGLLVIIPVSAVLGGVALMAISALGIWIAINFVDAAHAFNNLFKSAFVLIFGALGMAIAVTIVLALLGIAPNGMPANV